MMNKFVFAYYGEPHFTSEAAGKKYMADWREWVKSLGTASVDRGVPTKAGKTVSTHGVKDADGKDRFTGYSIVLAVSLDEAVKLAKACPHLKHGTIGVHEVMQMEMWWLALDSSAAPPPACGNLRGSG